MAGHARSKHLYRFFNLIGLNVHVTFRRTEGAHWTTNQRSLDECCQRARAWVGAAFPGSLQYKMVRVHTLHFRFEGSSVAIGVEAYCDDGKDRAKWGRVGGSDTDTVCASILSLRSALQVCAMAGYYQQPAFMDDYEQDPNPYVW